MKRAKKMDCWTKKKNKNRTEKRFVKIVKAVQKVSEMTSKDWQERLVVVQSSSNVYDKVLSEHLHQLLHRDNSDNQVNRDTRASPSSVKTLLR